MTGSRIFLQLLEAHSTANRRKHFDVDHVSDSILLLSDSHPSYEEQTTTTTRTSAKLYSPWIASEFFMLSAERHEGAPNETRNEERCHVREKASMHNSPKADGSSKKLGSSHLQEAQMMLGDPGLSSLRPT